MGKFNKLHKGLVLLSFSFLIVILIESIYLFSYRKVSRVAEKSNYESNNRSGLRRLKKSHISFSGVSDYLNRFDEGIFISTIVVSEFQGIIISVITEPGIRAAVNYKKGLFIKGTNGKINFFLFREKDLSNLRVYDQIEENIYPIQLEELKIGESVKLKQTFDLNNNRLYNLLETEIVKI